jgi:formate hydrogenlyase subunit 3/multisubunit Na+/H+ antiporter MnhD subunit
VPILASPNKPPGRGVLRYITLQSLGFPLLLFTGWIFERLSTGQGSEVMQIQVLFLIALGLLLMLGVFPFHTWIPMVAQESHPYTSSFVFYILPFSVMLVGLNYLDRFVWMQSEEIIFEGLAYLGAVMVLLGGLWASFQENIGRMLGFAAMLEIGLSLLAVSLTNISQISDPALGIFFSLTVPRALSLAVWALALIVLSYRITAVHEDEHNFIATLSLKQISGFARSLPFASVGLVLAIFSIGGFPLLAGFPGRFALLSLLERKPPIIAAFTLIGLIGLMIAALRTMAVLMLPRGDIGWNSMESWSERIFLGIGALLLILVGVLPQIYTPFLAQMAQVFSNILP